MSREAQVRCERLGVKSPEPTRRGEASLPSEALALRQDEGCRPMNIIIPDDYNDMVDRLECYSLIRHHDVTRWREPARDLDQLVARLQDADIVVSIRERVQFSRPLLERLPRLKLIALVGRSSKMIDFAACTDLGIPVSTGRSNSPDAPAELTLALILA